MISNLSPTHSAVLKKSYVQTSPVVVTVAILIDLLVTVAILIDLLVTVAILIDLSVTVAILIDLFS